MLLTIIFLGVSQINVAETLANENVFLYAEDEIHCRAQLTKREHTADPVSSIKKPKMDIKIDRSPMEPITIGPFIISQ